MKRLSHFFARRLAGDRATINNEIIMWMMIPVRQSNHSKNNPLLWCLILFSLQSWLCVIGASNGNKMNINDGRYSYSLSFFDPNGKLGQVERAVQAASSGIPILVLTRDDRILMAAPQVFPTALVIQSGTQRFAQVTPSIVISHTGLTADGRVLMTAAQRLAIEHEYVFDEDIPVAVLLEEMSLLFQEYTMKVGVRPFGACLIVASLSGIHDDDDDTTNEGKAAVVARSQVYRIDPSGSVTSLGPFALINTGDNKPSVKRMRDGLTGLHSNTNSSLDNDLECLVEMLQTELENDHRQLVAQSNQASEKKRDPVVSIRTAVISLGSGILEQQNHRIRSFPESNV